MSAGLGGCRVMITRAPEQLEALRRPLVERGASVIECPTIEFAGPADPERLERAVATVERYDWLVFTSVNGVHAYERVCRQLGRQPGTLEGPRLAAIGPATEGALRKLGLSVACAPNEHVAEALAATLSERGVAGARVLLLRAEKARDVLPRTLADEGAHVDVVSAYRTFAPPSIRPCVQEALETGLDIVTFTSSSTVENLVEALPEALLERLRQRVRVACIGPITRDSAERLGLPVAIVARDYTIPGLVAAIEENWTPPE